MRIYPALDLLNGQCVRLLEGKFNECTIYSSDPLAIAKNFATHGMQYLHVVDLNGAQSAKMEHKNIIAQIIANTSLQLQVGGGLRDFFSVKELLSLGVDRVILGSVAITQPEFFEQCLNEFGPEKIVLAIDVKSSENYRVAISGWQEISKFTLWDLLIAYQAYGVKNILCTDITKDGTLSGPNFFMYRRCLTLFPHLNIIASGGISSMNDIKKLQNLGVHSSIIGKAIYENQVSLTCLQNELFLA